MGVLCDVLLLHEPGPRAAGSPEELEGDEGLQERILPAAEGSRREGRSVALARAWGGAHSAHQGTGGLHRRWSRGPHEGRYLPVLIALRLVPHQARQYFSVDVLSPPGLFSS